MAASKRASGPGRVGFVDRAQNVGGTEVSQNARLGWVGGTDLVSALNREKVMLVEIYSGAHVGRNDAVVETYAVYLYGQQHRNPESIQVARGGNHRRSAPALSIQDKASGGELFRLESMVSICVERAPDQLQGKLPPMIGDRFRINARSFAQSKCKLPHASVLVVPPFKSSEETYDQRRARGEGRRRTQIREPLGTQHRRDQYSSKRRPFRRHGLGPLTIPMITSHTTRNTTGSLDESLWC